MKPIVLDLKIENHATGYENFAVCWNGEGYRHHFWVNDLPDDETLASGEPVDIRVYRNLPLDHPNVRGFNTRYLDGTKGYAKAALGVILPQLPAMLIKARAELAACRAAEQERFARARREVEARKRLHDAAPVLLEAAQAVLRAWEGGYLAAAVRSLSDAVDLATEE